MVDIAPLDSIVPTEQPTVIEEHINHILELHEEYKEALEILSPCQRVAIKATINILGNAVVPCNYSFLRCFLILVL